MRLSDIKALPLGNKRKKRVGRGRRSGHGKSSGRGQKGAHARSGAGGLRHHEGGQMPLFRRFPKRGFSNKTFETKYAVVNVEDLNGFPAGAEVNADVLVAKRLVREKGRPIKVLGAGDLKVALKVTANRFSKSAAEKIRKAGGEVRED